jgi:hypothetical protein
MEARSGHWRQVDMEATAKKEPVMKNRAYAVVLAAVVALMAASGASAKATSVHANVKLAKHSLVKQQKAASYRSIDRRWARGIF